MAWLNHRVFQYLFCCTFGVFFFSAASYSLTLVNPVARIPRDNNKQFELQFEMNAITRTDLTEAGFTDFTSANIQAMIIKKLDICINQTNCSAEGTIKVRYTNQSELDETVIDSDLSDEFYASFPSNSLSLQPDPSVIDRYNAQVRLLIEIENSDVTFNTEDKVSLDYGNVTEEVTATLTISSIVVSTPEGVTVTPSNESIVVGWTNKPLVDFHKSAQGAPSGMRVYLIPVSDPATLFTEAMIKYEEKIEDENTRYDCNLSANFDENTCTFSCANGTQIAYLDKERLLEINSTILVQDANPGVNSGAGITFGDLENIDQNYAIILQYLPSGARAGDDSSCVLASPIRTYSYAQLTSGKEPKAQDASCFIATAAYGSPLEPQLDHLRWFRDHVLLSFSLGQSFVEWYYKNSPPMANWIQQNPEFARITRGILYFPVATIEFYRKSSTQQIYAIVLLGFTAFMGLVIDRKRKRVS